MTAPFSISITTNAAQVVAALQATPAQVNRAVRAAMTDVTVLLMREAQTYPPPPAPIQGPAIIPIRRFSVAYTTLGGQTATRTVAMRANRAKGKGITLGSAKRLRYVRTNTLKRSWHRVITGEGNTLVGEVFSSGQTAPYNIYVQSAAHQARIHQGRWRTEKQILSDNRDFIRTAFERRIAEALR